MPYTYNGIGTSYHGHSNSERRTAACHSCGRPVSLESYDTRLWFVVFFIPIIPLGRKRIIDMCPICRRHFAVEADKWETQKQLNVSGSMEEYLADPTPEKAMAAHQQLINFHQSTKAGEFRREIGEKFRQNAKLQAYLGQSLLGQGMAQDAFIYFERALALRPDLPEARVGVAREHIQAGRLDEARALLDFLEKPGAAQLYSLEPVETLANAYERAGKRAEALELFQCLLTALPEIGQIKTFRNRVKACEKALGRKQSILPKWKFSWKRLFGNDGRPKQPGAVRVTWRGLAILAGLVGAIVGAVWLHDVYERHHRPIYMVNPFKTPATVEIRGEQTVTLPGQNRGAQKVEVAEGKYHVTITGPVREELDIEVKPHSRSNNPIWILNVGGAALLLEEAVTYQQSNPPPPQIAAHFGKTFEEVADINNPFTSLPKSISMDSHERSRVLRGIDYSTIAPDDLLNWFQVHNRTSEAAQLAEWQVKMDHTDQIALNAFVALATPKHAEEVLQAGLLRRPVELPWHRAYQNVHTGVAWDAWLVTTYDGMLKDEPGNSALLYLRGRVAPTAAEGAQWFAKAREADPNNPFPYYAQGYDRVSAGDWAGARPLLARAVELSPKALGFGGALYQCRLALEEYDPLEKELRAAMAKEPNDFAAKFRLVEVLLAQSRPTEADKVVKAAFEQARVTQDEGLAILAQELLWQYDYVAGKFDSMVQSIGKNHTPEARQRLFTALIEQGKIGDALRAYPLDKAKLDDAFTILTVSLACLVAHDNAQADTWLRKAAQLLTTGSADYNRAAALFAKDAVPTPETVAAVVLDAKSKAILLTTLGILHPDQRKELFAAARVLNVDRGFPYHLLHRILTEAH